MKHNNETCFVNRDCPYFPCHETGDPDEFNCLFCYCPLYALGESCGGNYCYTPNGIKDCSNCLLPHTQQGYSHVIDKFPDLARMAKKKES